ncbi:universal stress protein [Streptomyces justiciae]|uniref:universal stress protein n=1 Tax=Streptomyces justiciae TaxID=2780140 RepID=UPI00187ED0F9|nr:universal stress protein [Streptomyces justiciae]MBE8472013.1 universal stress protein [Streptomyces justiciae]
MPGKVTAQVDGSPESLAAAHWAAREALRRGAELGLVQVLGRDPRQTAGPAAGAGRHNGDEQPLERVIASVHAAHPGLPVTGRLLTGSVVGTLLPASDQTQLLVLGLRGRGGARGFADAAIPEHLVARCASPVVLVRAGESSADEHFPAPDGISPEEIPEIPYRDVMLGLDTARPCDELIEFAFASARRRAAVLQVVHARPLPAESAAHDTSAAAPEPAGDQERAVAAALRPWSEKYPTVPVVESVVAGPAGTALLRAAAGAALMVVGRQDHDERRDPHIGPLTRVVLHRARCPVAVVPCR